MGIVVVDKKGRIIIPSRVRRELDLRGGDKLLILTIKDDTLVLKRIDVEKLLRDIARAKLDLEELVREVEEEANRIAKEKVPARY